MGGAILNDSFNALRIRFLSPQDLVSENNDHLGFIHDMKIPGRTDNAADLETNIFHVGFRNFDLVELQLLSLSFVLQKRTLGLYDVYLLEHGEIF